MEPALTPEDAPEEACPRPDSRVSTEPSSRRRMPEPPRTGTGGTDGTGPETAAVTVSPHTPVDPASGEADEADTKGPLVWQGNPLSPEGPSVSPVERLVQAAVSRRRTG